MVIDNCYDTLFEFDYLGGRPTEMVGVLAESYDVSEDGLVYTIHLRKGIFFQSGNPVNAEAVKFSFDRILALGYKPAANLLGYGMEEGCVSVIDEYTVQITLNKPYAPFAAAVFTTRLSAVVDPAVMEHEVDGDWASGWLRDHTAGSGPYYLEYFNLPEDKLVLRANENYWRGAPKIKKITILNIPEHSVQRMMLEKGDIDLAWDLTADDIALIKDKPGIKVETFPTSAVTVLSPNFREEFGSPLLDVKVRKAVAYALDYDGIIEYIVGGYAERQYGIIYKEFGLEPETPYYDYDPEKAKALLDEAGYPEVEDGKRDLTLRLLLYAPKMILGVHQSDLALKIADDLMKVGITVKIEAYSTPVRAAKCIEGDFDMFLCPHGAPLFDIDMFPRYMLYSQSWCTKNWFAYSNPEIDELLDEGAATVDYAKRIEIYREIQRIWADTLPNIILFRQTSPFAFSTKLKNVEILINEPTAIFRSWDITS